MCPGCLPPGPAPAALQVSRSCPWPLCLSHLLLGDSSLLSHAPRVLLGVRSCCPCSTFVAWGLQLLSLAPHLLLGRRSCCLLLAVLFLQVRVSCCVHTSCDPCRVKNSFLAIMWSMKGILCCSASVCHTKCSYSRSGCLGTTCSAMLLGMCAAAS